MENLETKEFDFEEAINKLTSGRINRVKTALTLAQHWEDEARHLLKEYADWEITGEDETRRIQAESKRDTQISKMLTRLNAMIEVVTDAQESTMEPLAKGLLFDAFLYGILKDLKVMKEELESL